MKLTLSYLPGRGSLKEGDKVKYVGTGDDTVQEVPFGTIGTVEKDFGYDYRYLIRTDEVVLLYPNREPPYRRMGDCVRTGSRGWEKIC